MILCCVSVINVSTLNINNLRQLIEIKHEEVKYPCNECEFASSTVSHIRQHIESKHEYPLSNLGFRIVRRRNKDVQYCPKNCGI